MPLAHLIVAFDKVAFGLHRVGRLEGRKEKKELGRGCCKHIVDRVGNKGLEGIVRIGFGERRWSLHSLER